MNLKSPTPLRIRGARKDANLSQTQAAELVGRSLRTWQDWEWGTARMPLELWELWQYKVKEAKKGGRKHVSANG